MARGPIHEAFAQPAIRKPWSASVIAKEPPKPIEELPPDQRPEGENVQWIPGYWAWDDDPKDFLWVSGTFRIVPPGRHWVPGYWNQTDDGWQRIVGFWGVQEQDEIDLLPAPPDPIEEAVPPAPNDASIFQPGCWVYRDSRYLWRPGFWNPYRAGWNWTASSYAWTPGGYAFVDGYWDYPFHNRGLLFAPVNIDRRFWGRSGWSYQPSYVVQNHFLLGSLFVWPSHQQYYFGDYYDRRYDSLGFVPWTDFRYGRTIVDPLFSHYQHQYRDNPGWSRDLRQLYVARREDPAARPPRTLLQQNTVINNITNKTVTVNKVTNLTNVTAVTSLTKVDHTFVKLQPVTKEQHAEVRKTASQFRDFSTQRGNLEAQAGKKIQPSTDPGALPKGIKVGLPKTRPAAVKTADGAHANAPPARPPEPKPVAKPVPQNPPEHKAEAPAKPQPRPAPKPDSKPAPKPDQNKGKP